MAAKQLVFSEDARRKLRTGMNVVANAVGATLGPKGRNVAVDRKFGSPMITHDGVSVAKEIELEDPFENMGAQMVRQVASKTNDVVGAHLEADLLVHVATLRGQQDDRDGGRRARAGPPDRGADARQLPLRGRFGDSVFPPHRRRRS